MAGYITKRTTARGKDVCSMRNEKGIGVALGLAVILGLTGCAGTEEVSAGVYEDASAETGTETEADGESKDVKEGNDGTDTTETQAGEWKREELVSAKEPKTEHAEKDAGESEEPEEAGQAVLAAEGTQYLGGKVQSPQTDGMTLARTTLMNEDNTVTMLDDKDAEKIPVRFTADTKVEHWTISGGGAGIDMRDADVSDLEEGMGVELEGYYDGDTFMATRVIMEEYV